MRRFRYVVADVFTDVPFAGNQLAVFTDARDLDGPTMQALAREREGPRIVFGRMEQPIPTWEPVADPGPIFAAVGVVDSGLPVEQYKLGPGHLYIELGSAEAVAALEPDFPALARLTDAGVNC